MGRFNLSLPSRQLSTMRFGGLFTEADPRSLPEGASYLAQDVDFLIAGVDIRPGLTSVASLPGIPQYVKTALLGTQYTNLAQDETGTLYQQPVSGGSFSPFYSGILNNARALSFSANFREYICLSNLYQGTDQPRQFDGTNLDRISQMGPGVPPTVTPVAGAANPGSPTLSVVSGGSLPARYEYVVIAYVTTAGALIPSVEASIFIPANYLLNVASPPSASGVSGWNVYVGFSSGSETQQAGTIPIGTAYTEPSTGISSGGAPAPSLDVAAGDRYGILMYLTRSGFITPASPPVKFTTAANTAQLQLGNLCIGPPNIISRIFAWTPANAAIGGPYFYVPVLTIDPNGNPANSSIIGDNFSTSATLSISDTVLQAGINVSTEGNNMLTIRELGEPVKGLQYSGRSFYIGARNKVDTFVNTTFDGGYAPSNPISGWTVNSQASGIVQKLIQSPIFGFSYYFQNGLSQEINVISGSSYALPQNNILQGASLTAFNTPILVQDRSYGIRATVWSPGGNTSGQIWIGFSSASLGLIVAAQIPCSQLTGSPKEFIYPLNPPYLPIGAAGGPGFPTPPFTVPPGQYVAWAFPTKSNVPAPGESGECSFGAGTFTNSAVAGPWGTGSLSMEGIHYLDSNSQVVATQYAGFSMPELPSDASVQAMYPVFVVTGNISGVNGSIIQNYLNNVPQTQFSLDPLSKIIPGLQSGITIVGDGIFSSSSSPTEVSVGIAGNSLGNTARVLENTVISIGLEQTSVMCGQSYQLNILMAGVAIYYTTANPPQYPPYSPQTQGYSIIPSDLQFFVAPVNFPAGADFAVDRIEVFDWNQPVLSSQVVVSYAQNQEAFDGVTGLLDISNFTTDPIQNIFRFLNQVYICTQSRWFAAQDNGTTEPSGWTINEVSNAVGCLGPMAEDVGEEYVLCADLRGVWLFDGGSHVKLSQEIQQLWETIAEEYQAGVWIVNDRYQQRLLVGIPSPQPTPWTILPESSPSSNNIILMCSYLTLAPGSQIATSPGVMVSMFTGQLMNREGARKWAVWSIPANYASWIRNAEGGETFWLCSSAGNNIFFLDPGNLTDNGVEIPQYWGSYAFSDHISEEQYQLGSVRKLYLYASVLMDVNGQFVLKIMPETPSTPYAVTLPPLSGQNPALDDTNIPLNISGNRMFLLFGTDGNAGSRFRLRRIVLGCLMHPRLPVSGRIP